MKKYNKKGFTLIELLAVVAILSLLVLLALPNVIDALNKSRKNTFLTEAKTVYRTAADKYMSEGLLGNKISSIYSEDSSRLDINASSDLQYCIILDEEGKVDKIAIGNKNFYIIKNKISSVNDIRDEDIYSGNLENMICDSKTFDIDINCEYDGRLKDGAKYTNENYEYTYDKEKEQWSVIITTDLVKDSKICTTIKGKPVVHTLKYRITFDKQEGTGGTDKVELFYKDEMPNINIPTKENFGFGGYYKEVNKSGQKYYDALGKGIGTWNIDSDATLYAFWDGERPTGSIESTNNIKSTKQTVTLKCDDDNEISGYYFGTKENPNIEEYTPIAATPNMVITKDVTTSGNYKLYCKDVANNISQEVSKTYYTYKVNNMLQNTSGSTYTTTNYKSNTSYTYLALDATEINMSNVYTVPTGSNENKLSVYSIGEPSTAPATIINKSTTQKLTENSVYTMWFYRNNIYVKYKTNAGILTASTKDSTGTETYKWATDSNGYITKSVNNSTAISNLNSYRYGTTIVDLIDLNDPTHLNITKTGYTALANSQWICESGCTTPNKTFSQSQIKLNSSNDMCNALTNDCTIVLKPNWKTNTYTVIYNGNGATSGSTSSSTHVYNTSKQLTANGFTRTKHTFNGWNTKADGTGSSYTNSQSVLNLTAINNGTVTLYAQWKSMEVTSSNIDTTVVCNNLNTSIKDPIIKYTGNCSYSIVDGSEWRLKLLTSGTLTVTTKTPIDAFLVGGGGGGSCCSCEPKHGGSGGKTTTFKTTLEVGTNYSVTIGGGGASNGGAGGSTSAFGKSIAGGTLTSGGSGGGGPMVYMIPPRPGASYGANGTGGSGQGTTTCEFGEGTTSGCTRGDAYAYSGGGGGVGSSQTNSLWYASPGGVGGGGAAGGGGNYNYQCMTNNGQNGKDNTGGGGGVGHTGGKGGSGVVVIRRQK